MQNRVTRYGSILAVLLMMMLAACGGGGASNTSSTSSAGPADVIKSLFNGMFKGEDITNFVCSASADQIKQGLEAMKTAFTTGGAEIDTSGMTFTVKSESGDKAEVEVAGKIKITVSGTSTEQDYPATPIPLIKENGAWKACG